MLDVELLPNRDPAYRRILVNSVSGKSEAPVGSDIEGGFRLEFGYRTAPVMSK